MTHTTMLALFGPNMTNKSGAGAALAMIAALVAITLAVFIWAAFFRRPPRHRHHSHHRQHRSSSEPERTETTDAANESEAESASDGKSSRFRRRRRRHKDRRLNPTLAKTGGLPGIRGDGSAPGTSE